MRDILEHPIPMNQKEMLILSLIKNRRRNDAIPNNEIQDRTGLKERHIRQIIQRLIIMYRQPIGSSTGAHKGYYWIKNIEEAEHNYRRLRSRALIILKRAATLRNIGMEEMINQLKFDFQGGKNVKNEKSTRNPLRLLLRGVRRLKGNEGL